MHPTSRALAWRGQPTRPRKSLSAKGLPFTSRGSSATANRCPNPRPESRECLSPPEVFMNENIPQLSSYDEPALDAAFSGLFEEVKSAWPLRSNEEIESFRLHWLGRKQGRLKLISDAWLKSAPAEARKPLGMRFNQLKQRVETALAEAEAAPAARAVKAGIDITLPGTVRAPGIEHPLLKTMNQIVAVFHHLGYSTALGPQVESDFYNFEAL